jgi:hypothetical protein
MYRHPYVCLVARGFHDHHPPYPTRMPKDIADDVIAVLGRGGVLDTTARMLTLS